MPEIAACVALVLSSDPANVAVFFSAVCIAKLSGHLPVSCYSLFSKVYFKLIFFFFFFLCIILIIIIPVNL